jgi:AraC-like DNA-binding protein
VFPRIEDYRLTPARPFHGGVVQHDHLTPLAMDMHQAFEVGVVLAGELARHLGDLVITLRPGEMWLCGAWEPHGWRPRLEGTQELVLQFLPDFLGEEVLDGVSWLSLFSAPPERRPRVTSEDERRKALAIATEIREEMRDRRRGWLAAVRLGALQLLLLLGRGREPSGKPSRAASARTGDLAKIMPAVRLVHSDPTRRLGLKEAAAACGLSVSQFSYVFRHLMGLSFGKFCMRTRLGYVAQLLLTTGLTVDAIAEAAHFSDASHLHHAFVKAYGSTPSRYRADGQVLPTGRVYTELEEVAVEDYGPPSAS